MLQFDTPVISAACNIILPRSAMTSVARKAGSFEMPVNRVFAYFDRLLKIAETVSLQFA